MFLTLPWKQTMPFITGGSMRLSRLLAATCCAFATATICSPAIAADSYPTKPIRLIVPFTPGGLSDALARILARNIAKDWNQQVVIDNRPGAGTTLAADIVAKSPADGYTLFYQDITTHGINAGVYRKLPYNSLKDFAPIAMVSASPLIMCVHPSLPVKSVKELVALAKAKPGQISFGSSGNGTILHLSGAILMKLAGIELTHVPYKGSGQAVLAVLSGEVAMTFGTTTAVIPHLKAAKIRGLGVTTKERSPIFPDLPPIGETVPGYDVKLYQGILAPAGTPAAIVKKLNEELNRIMARKEIKDQWATYGAETVLLSTDEFAARFKNEVETLSRIAIESGARVD
jgi:tripartite-type tricarboxylate transporter receptor subunit TctC